jgi:hypothetical protein
MILPFSFTGAKTSSSHSRATLASSKHAQPHIGLESRPQSFDSGNICPQASTRDTLQTTHTSSVLPTPRRGASCPGSSRWRPIVSWQLGEESRVGWHASIATPADLRKGRALCCIWDCRCLYRNATRQGPSGGWRGTWPRYS